MNRTQWKKIGQSVGFRLRPAFAAPALARGNQVECANTFAATREPAPSRSCAVCRHPGLRLALTILATVLAGGLFVASLGMPVWHLKMEAPQYQDQEALRVRVYPGSMQGDLREIELLNHYVGVHLPKHLVQLRWLPIALVAAAVGGLGATLLPRRMRRPALLAVATSLSLVMAASAGLAQYQMHQIGHDRDQHTALKGIKDFTPPLLGSVKVANFQITTGLSLGAWLIAAGIILQATAGLLWGRSQAQDSANHKRSKIPHTSS